MPYPLNHSDATVNISIDGLAICCFNRRQKLWKIAFLHWQEHVFEMKVDGTRIPLLRNGRYPNKIKISTKGGIEPHYAAYPEGFWFHVGTFDRDPNTDHLEDFRWVVDFADPLFNHGTVNTQPTSCKVTLLEIENAIFYNKKITKFSMIPAPNGSTTPYSYAPMGSINDLIGADVLCEAGGAVVIHIPDHDDITLGSPSAPHRIEFINLEPEKAELTEDRKANGYEKGDFYVYYDALKIKGNQKWDIWGPPKSITQNGRIDCDSVRVSTLSDLDEIDS